MAKPPWFYHYTTAEGIIGILDEKNIWATDANYLNDYAEIRRGIFYAWEWFKQNLSEIKNIMGDKYINTLVANLEHEPWKQSGQRMYICSFSTERDSLSQWRGYGGKMGYSIGFHQNYLMKKAEELGLDFVQCIYEHNESKNPVRDALDKLMESGHFGQALTSMNEILDSTLTVIHVIQANSVALKGEGFKDEREWRIYPKIKNERYENSGIEDESYRVENGIFIPYIKYPLFPKIMKESLIPTLDNKPLPSIKFMIGPTLHRDIAYDGLNRFLLERQCEFLYSEPEHSLVTYRPLNE